MTDDFDGAINASYEKAQNALRKVLDEAEGLKFKIALALSHEKKAMPPGGDASGMAAAALEVVARLAEAGAFEDAKLDEQTKRNATGYRPAPGDTVILPRRSTGQGHPLYQVTLTDVVGNGASDTLVWLRPWMEPVGQPDGEDGEDERDPDEKWTLRELWEFGVRPAGDAEQRAALAKWHREHADDPVPRETTSEKIARIDGVWSEPPWGSEQEDK